MNTAQTQANNTQATTKDPNTVELETPIKRGDSTITSVTLRKPNAGELRGVSLSELLQLKVDSIQAVVPRISSPALNKHDMASMDAADLVAMGSVVIGFLLTKEQKRDFLTE